jgi:electron transport complex protein RnfC
MMGRAVASADIPVTKGTSGILIMPETEAKREKMKDCIRCGRCITVCPMGLEPFYLMLVADKQIWDKAEASKIMDCIECGSCSYTCPADRPLLDYIRLGKGKVGTIIRSRKK